MVVRRQRASAVPARSLVVEHLAIESVQMRGTNSRVHSKVQTSKLAESVRRFGFVVPVLIDDDNVLLAGHGRLEAARFLGLSTVPTIRVSGLTPAQQRAFVIADNKLTDLSAFDPKKLKTEFEFLLGSGEDFVIEATGFDIVEVDKLLNFDSVIPGGEEVELPADNAAAVSRLGDLWHVGGHRLLCGSALDRACYARLFGTEQAAMIFTDPPYNVPIGGNVSGLGRTKHREFAMASGEMSQSEFTYQFLRPVFEHIRDHAIAAAIAYVCMDWRPPRDRRASVHGGQSGGGRP